MEQEFFAQFANSFVPIVQTLKQIYITFNKTLATGSTKLSSFVSVGNEAIKILKAMKAGKDEVEHALTGFTKSEQSFLKKRVLYFLKSLVTSTDDSGNSLTAMNGKLETSVIHNAQLLLETAKHARNLDLKRLEKILPALKKENYLDLVFEEMTWEEFKETIKV